MDTEEEDFLNASINDLNLCFGKSGRRGNDMVKDEDLPDYWDLYDEVRELKAENKRLRLVVSVQEEEIDKLDEDNTDLLLKWTSAVNSSYNRMVGALLNGAKAEHFVPVVGAGEEK